MTHKAKKLDVSASEIDVITRALETQTKILSMQASAGGHGALERLNEVKRVLANVSAQTQTAQPKRAPQGGIWGILRSVGQAI